MKKYRIAYDLDSPEQPKPHEKHAAQIVANYFRSDVFFIRKKVGTTPDLKILKTLQIWELKSPLGNGKRTIANNLRGASHQSENIILDLSRCKMNNLNALSRVKGFLKSGDAHLKRLIIIKKGGEVLDVNLKKV